jgi:hypothetical protein
LAPTIVSFWFATSSWTISRRENTIFTSSLERHRFTLLLKKI